MSQGKMLSKAISIAAQSHEGVCDKGGRAYILHPMRVMMRLRTDDEALMMIAILHDVVEDDPVWTLEGLTEAGFDPREVGALDCLTHRENESYGDYVRRVATNEDAIRVKLEDLRDNSDITRLKGITGKDLKRMEKYHKSFLFLQNAKKNLELLK